MSSWPSSKANRVLAALYRIGWTLKRQSGSHKTLSRPGWPDVVYAFHDRLGRLGLALLVGGFVLQLASDFF